MPRKKILLVDDSSTILMTERMILGGESYDLLTASDGQEAVEKAMNERPDLIVMDVMMPRMGGIEACRRMREIDQTRSIPIIMAITPGESQAIEAALCSGCDDYITKPIGSIELLSKLKARLGE